MALVTSQDTSAKIWNISKQQVNCIIASNVCAAIFSPDGNNFATVTTKNKIYVRNSNNGKIVNTLDGHRSQINTIVFNRDGSSILSASNDKSIVWDIVSGKMKMVIPGYGHLATFSQNCDKILAVSTENTAFNSKVLPMSSYKISRAIEFDFLKLLKSERVISEYTISNNNTVSFNTIDDTFYRFLSEKGGNLFEMLVYYKLLHTGIFGDAQTGVSFQWKSGGSDYIKNEIDVVATNGVNLVLVSCKTNPIIDNAFIYEIASEAASFGGIAVLATSQDLSNPLNYNHNAVVRARAMNVALIDQHILRDEQLLKKAVNQILTGKFRGPENF